MDKIQLRGTDCRVSRIALGTALFGTTIPEETAFEMMDLYASAGGNLLDTASVYADWLAEKSISEKTIGKWMKARGNREELVLSTKGGHPPCGAHHISRINRAEIKKDIEQSLQNLMTDHVDLYYLHRDDVTVPVGEIMELLHEFVLAGKTRYIAVSNWSPVRIRQAQEYCFEHGLSPIVSSQIQFSVAHPNAKYLDPTTEYMTEEHFSYYQESRMNVLAFSSQAGGYFSRKGENGKPQSRPQYDNAVNDELYRMMVGFCEKYACTMEEIAVGALCANPYFTTVPIIGCSRIQQLLPSLKGADLKLRKEDAVILLERRTMQRHNEKLAASSSEA